MAKINLLDKTIYNRIAAGEVVERPSSIVKECVENSLDANATSICVEIKNGGIKQIIISDNGDGIEYSELKKVFMPHATSKISSVEDLDKISTLGFRGEALASIGSVSMVNVKSKYKESEIGGQINMNGGDISNPEPFGCPTGTTITVKNLFYNVPARAKFLRSEKTEEAHITNLMSRFILANPSVNFKYIVNDKIIYQTIGKTLLDAIYVIYGKEIANNLLPINIKNNDISLNGYVCKPVYAKPNKTYQTLVINGRYVNNNIISSAVYSAFENYLLKNKYPLFILHLQIPFDQIDVNVHPNKMDVKFENSNKVFGIVLNAVSQALLNANNIVDVVEEDKVDNINQSTKLNEVANGISFNTQSFNKITDPSEIFNAIKPVIISKEPTQNITLKQEDSIFTKLDKQDYIKNEFNNQSSIFDNLKSDKSYKYVGTLFNTYNIIEFENNAYIIDQHAAHERLLYQSYTENYNTGMPVIQDLLVPYIFKVNYNEKQFINDNISEFKKLGFDIEEFGMQDYKLNSVPLILQDINVKTFIDDVLNNLDFVSKDALQIKNFLATKACKAAVKGGQKLTDNEINKLMDEIISTKTPLLCPHGRPIVIKITIQELEKWFKRIV